MVRIFLCAALVRQEIVIATASNWIIAADRRPCLIDGAAALFGVEEAADAAEMVVGLAAHLEFAAVLFVAVGDELGFGFAEGQLEVFGKPLEIAPCHRDGTRCGGGGIGVQRAAS